ncbi:hypothetical protein BDQ12DRAFT_683292 [Crucibulum laeve]|uniref:Uncharacterized protein n=1 Tax=Crucibulum laeve TaxID=68775 RepID=A0A5C3M185_9AGAR|nr:hypothetical protein BDQ12DRAFT_683292 [Crucibulum laeve]
MAFLAASLPAFYLLSKVVKVLRTTHRNLSVTVAKISYPPVIFPICIFHELVTKFYVRKRSYTFRAVTRLHFTFLTLQSV